MGTEPDRITLPRQYARTRRFTLGQPRSFHIASDGSRIAFLRSKGGEDPVTCLWTLDLGSGEERLVFDPRTHTASDGDLPPEERARRERVREVAEGVVGYGADRAVSKASFAVG